MPTNTGAPLKIYPHAQVDDFRTQKLRKQLVCDLRSFVMSCLCALDIYFLTVLCVFMFFMTRSSSTFPDSVLRTLLLSDFSETYSAQENTFKTDVTDMSKCWRGKAILETTLYEVISSKLLAECPVKGIKRGKGKIVLQTARVRLGLYHVSMAGRSSQYVNRQWI